MTEAIAVTDSWAYTEFPGMDARKVIILEALRRGNTREASATCVNVTKQTFYHWLKIDLTFSDGVTRAEALCEIEFVGYLKVAASTDYKACIEWLRRRRGKTWRTHDEELAAERMRFIRQQRKAGLIEAQAKELNARGDKAIIETEMWPKQFVTEEEEVANLQALAAAANKPLLTMTPEAFADILEGKDPAAALEELKGVLGRSQAEILKDILYKGQGAEEEDEEEDEAG